MNLKLNNITLYSLNCFNPERSIRALLYSSRHIDFADMILVTDQDISQIKIPSNIRVVRTNIQGLKEASQFSYRELPNLIKTEYALGIHDDGFVTNPHLWDDNFYNYDYIGAPWNLQYPLRNRVGNGGFVFRSNRFIQLTRPLSNLGGHDDGELTNTYYDYFVSRGCRYAPIQVAMRFSLESKIPECSYDLNNCFGFHGRGRRGPANDDPRIDDLETQQFLDKQKLLDGVIL